MLNFLNSTSGWDWKKAVYSNKFHPFNPFKNGNYLIHSNLSNFAIN